MGSAVKVALRRTATKGAWDMLGEVWGRVKGDSMGGIAGAD